MDAVHSQLSELLSEVVMTGHYLAEPSRQTTNVLHDAEMKCLKIIHDFGPLHMQQIATYLYATKPRATQLVVALEQIGYVSRTSGADHRTKVVQITAKGNRSVADARHKYDDLALRIKQNLGDDKTVELCALLSAITPLARMYNETREEPQ